MLNNETLNKPTPYVDKHMSMFFPSFRFHIFHISSEKVEDLNKILLPFYQISAIAR